MAHTICGAECAGCPMESSCGGCAETGGRPFGTPCMLADCCRERGYTRCGECSGTPCGLQTRLLEEFNALGIAELEEVTLLHALPGAFVNLEYTLPNGQKAKLLDDHKVYLGSQCRKRGGERCYGIAADEQYLLVCEYGEAGAEPEIVVYKRRKNH